MAPDPVTPFAPQPATMPEELASALALVRHRLDRIAHRALWYPEVGSTNDVASLLAERNAAEGLVVIADRQTAGRGRLGRTWVSPSGAGIYTSIVLRPSPEAASLLTIAAGVAVADGIASATGLEAQLKWPNDLYVAGRKLAGILAEGTIHFVVLGIGINVQPAAYPAEVAARATAIESELGRPADRALVLAECLAALAARYRDLHASGGRVVIDAWRRRAAAMLGRRVQWEADGRWQTGLADDIAEDGALVVKTVSGPLRIRSGEVRWL